MKKILFFIENKWAYGKIHNDLIKALYPDVHCDIIDWTVSYSHEDMRHFLNIYDYIVTTPAGGTTLKQSYGVNPNRIAIIAHSNHDFQHTLFVENEALDFFNEFSGYGAISPVIRTLSIAHRIRRFPNVLLPGTFTNIYSKNTSKSLNKIGYVGLINKVQNNVEGIDIKRGHLVSKTVEAVNLELIQYSGLHFLTAANFYCDFDILMFSSTTEGLPTVALEAISSGIPVIGTDTGIMSDIANSGAGIILPFEEDKYIAEGINVLNYLKNNPEEYQKMVSCALQKAKEYDWSVRRKAWIEFINSLYI